MAINRFVSRLWLTLFAAITFSLATNVYAQLSDQVSGELEITVLEQSWEKVIKLIDAEENADMSPVLSMLKGHAALALNKNNESVTLFYKLTIEGLGAWRKWGEDFFSRHGERSITAYFLGDAYARAGDPDKAYEYFTTSIAIDPKNYLALNARGVVLTLRGDYGKSISDFMKAMRVKSNFVDPKVNLAVLRVSQGQGRRGAIKRFQSIIKSEPELALAYHGLGFVELLSVPGGTPETNTNIQKALELMPKAQDLLISNEIRFINALLEKKSLYIANNYSKEGTTIEKSFRYKQVKLEGALKQLDIAQDYGRSKFFNRGIKKKRVELAVKLVQNNASAMSDRELRQFGRNYPALAAKIDSVVTAEDKRHKGYESMAAMGEIVTTTMSRVADAVTVASTLAGAKNPTIGVQAAYTSLIMQPLKKNSDLNAAGFRETKNNISRNRAEYKRIKSNLNRGANNFSAPETPTSSQDFSRSYPEIPGAFNSLGGPPPPPPPGGSPGGATTDKTNITWDDNEWPFIPIFGLLYFAPQVDSEKGSG